MADCGWMPLLVVGRESDVIRLCSSFSIALLTVAKVKSSFFNVESVILTSS